ncbi:MAG: hypothetical protein ABI548_01730 [Polyangiaceae bacterium]
MPRETQRSTASAPGGQCVVAGAAAWRAWVGFVFFGVLLCGCGSLATGAERARRSTSAERDAPRLGRHIPSVTGKESLTFTLKLDDAFTRMDVEACPHGFALEGLNAPSPNAQALLAGGKIITPEGDTPCPDENVALPHLKRDECVRYSVLFPVLPLSPQGSPDPTAFRRVDSDLLASPDLWLWVPTPRPIGVRIHAHFMLPAGVSAALPWSGSGSGSDFEIPETAFAWKSAGAFTHSAPSAPLDVPGTQLDLAVLGAGFPDHEGEVRAWLEQGARTSSLLFGGFPVKRAQVIAVPGDRSGPAFGMALRGGGPTVVILLDRHASAATLHEDWTCTHEFLHLGVPRLPPEDAWLFEGVATYYTEITRARAGVISPQQAAQHLLQGFARGRAGAGKHTLREDSSEMRARHAFFRVYWSGAALAFLTDIAARRAGGSSLDAALRSFAACCAASAEDWTAERVLAHLDASLGAPRFANQAHAWLDRKEFPDVDSTLRALGIALGRHGEAVFSRAADTALRNSLFAVDASQTPADREPHQAR